MRHILCAMLVFFLVTGLILAIQPSIKKTFRLKRQSQLLEDINSAILTGYAQQQVPRMQEPQKSDLKASSPVSGTIDEPNTAIGILEIDTIELCLPVVEGVTETQLKIAVGHVPQTAAIGNEGNAVIAGHRSYTYGHNFNRLGELKQGDIIRYTDRSGAELLFSVTEILTVEPDDPIAFAQPTNTRQLTLFTCTPIETATHRLLVRALREDSL